MQLQIRNRRYGNDVKAWFIRCATKKSTGKVLRMVGIEHFNENNIHSHTQMILYCFCILFCDYTLCFCSTKLYIWYYVLLSRYIQYCTQNNDRSSTFVIFCSFLFTFSNTLNTILFCDWDHLHTHEFCCSCLWLIEMKLSVCEIVCWMDFYDSQYKWVCGTQNHTHLRKLLTKTCWSYFRWHVLRVHVRTRTL
jgi:hypothetical protein